MSVVNVSEIKAHLNIDTDEDDTILASKLAVAEAYIGEYVGGPLSELTSVPEPLKEALRMLAGFLYENREAASDIRFDDLPFGFWDLIAPYRTWGFG